MIGSSMKAVVGFVMILALVSFAATAGETQEPSADRSDGGDQKTEEAQPSPLVQATGGKADGKREKVYGNDDLEKMFGPAPARADGSSVANSDESATEKPKAAASAATAGDSALDQLFAGEARKREHAASIAAAETQVAEAKQRLADLEKRLLASRNPLLARPKPPEEGAEEWNRADAAGRVEQTQAGIEAARKAVAEAQRELAALRSAAP